ncbi:hypothetical protein BDA96_03G186400 [Sorghum bicolor]|uniref:Uncharacterized protein n=1 Tax=Sorghum bicolor TaxID=4558 RepID=A0A921RDI4_SORBI|nr:hypothetical protein BDA96_03G186400 [Sorghum bicolor]
MSYATLKNVWAVKADFFYKTTSLREHEVNIGSVGEECELQPSQSPHKKQKK